MIAVAPITLALASMIITGLLRHSARQALISYILSGLQFLLAGYLLLKTASGDFFVVQSGHWPAPFGITIIIDLTSSLFLFVSSFLMGVVHIYCHSTYTPTLTKSFHPLWHALSLGVYGAFCTGDLFNLFVWFEVMLMSSFALSALGTQRAQWSATFSSVAMNLLGSSCFLLGLGFLYNATGSLNHADLVLDTSSTSARNIAAFLLIFAFALKSGAFPLYHWLPATYPAFPIGPLSLFAGLLTKVGVYTLIRFFSVPSAFNDGSTWSYLLWVSALFTMLLGVISAASQNSMRKILSFHIISQVGYMLLALGVGSVLGVAACLFYVIHHMVVKTNLFLVAGAFEESQGSSELKKIGSGFKKYRLLTAGFLISALSLTGIPPLSGFWAKITVLGNSAFQGDYIGLFVGLLVGILTFFSMSKIWSEGFLKTAPEGTTFKPISKFKLIAITILSIWTLWLGLFPSTFLQLSERAAQQLQNPARYEQVLQSNLKEAP